MFRGLQMDRQQSRSRGEKHIKEILRRLDHDMHVKKRLRIPFAQRADERRSIREVRDKVPVHDIYMEPIGFALKLSDVTLHIEDISREGAMMISLPFFSSFSCNGPAIQNLLQGKSLCAPRPYRERSLRCILHC